MKKQIHQLSLFDEQELPPEVPESAAALTSPRWPTPQDVALNILERVRIWQRKHPGCDWHEIVTPDWHDYVARNIK